MYLRMVMITALLSVVGSVQWDDHIQDQIHDMAKTVLSCRMMVALNLAIVHHNQTLLTAGYGYTDVAATRNADQLTRFGIASISKGFAATLLAKVLSEQSRFSWDTVVRDVIGDEMYFPTTEMTLKTRIKDLLSHNTGISSSNYVRIQENFDRQELVRRVRFLTPVREYKTSYLYNNLMYGLISRVTEVIGGQSWEDLMAEKIFGPLGMTNTNFTHTMDLGADDVAHPHLWTGDVWREVSLFLHSEWGKLGGSGSIVSSAVDMAKYLKMQLAMGQDESGQQVVPSDLLQDSHTPINNIPMSSSDAQWVRPSAPVTYALQNYAYGWRTGYYRGFPLVSHTGTSFGYGALSTLVPSLGIGIHTSMSGEDPGYLGRRALHLYAIDLMLGEEPWLNTSSACTFPGKTKVRQRSYKSNRDNMNNVNIDHSVYLGTYGNFAYGNLTVVEEDGGLVIKMGILGDWVLHEEEEHIFTGEGRGDTWSMILTDVAFSVFEESHATFVELPSLDRNAPPLFERGLKAADAPEPPPLSCSTSGSSVVLGSLLITSFTLFVSLTPWKSIL